VLAANIAGIAGRGDLHVYGDYDTRSARLQNIDQGTPYAPRTSASRSWPSTPSTGHGVLCYIKPFGWAPGRAPTPTSEHQRRDLARRAHLEPRARRRHGAPFQTFAEWEAFVDQTLDEGVLETTNRERGVVFPPHNDSPLLLKLDESLLTTSPSAQDVVRHRAFRAGSTRPCRRPRP